MAFDYFKKRKKEKFLREHLSGFQDSFSENEKKAMMYGLMMIATADRNLHEKELEYFEETSMMLGYKINSNLDDTLANLMTMNSDVVFNTLNKLHGSNRDWFIITVFGMIHADGVRLETEYQMAVVIFDKMEISEEYCFNVLKKHKLFMEMVGAKN